MKEDQFITLNTAIWAELETFSALINKKSIKTLPSKDVKRFLHVFRLSSHHLAYARTHYPESSLVSYLNALIGKCHSHVYAVNKLSPGQLWRHILYGFPALLKASRLYVLAAFGFFALGVGISLLLVLQNAGNAGLFLPQSMIDGIKSTAARNSEWNYPLMSSYIMVNNISVALKAFVLGITLGIGTIYVLFFNGAVLGALTGLIYLYGSPINYWSLILPHGIIELTAVFIAGAAGLIIAKSFLLPGEYSRRHALIKGSKKAVSLLAGVVFMLVIAGVIEGFFTPLNIAEGIKLLFAAMTALILTAYFCVPYLVKK